MTCTTFPTPCMAAKTPAERLDYKFDWSSVLATGETIESATVAVSPAGLAVDGSATTAGTTVTVWLMGGADGVDYAVTNTIVTSQGRTFQSTFILPVRAVA